jgi:hypothetical protein
MPEGRKHRCSFCLKAFLKAKHVQLHIGNTPKCHTDRDREMNSRSISPLVDTGSSNPNPPDLDPMVADNMDGFAGHDETNYVPSGRVGQLDNDTNEGMQSQSRHTTAANAPDRFAEDYPADVAHILRKSKTTFQILKEKQNRLGEEPWAPFKDNDEWELAQFLVTEVSQTAANKFFKLPIVRARFS